MIGSMLFVLAIAGQDRPSFATEIVGRPVFVPAPVSRIPANWSGHALEIEPILPGAEIKAE